MFRFSVWVMRKTRPEVAEALAILERGDAADLAGMTRMRVEALRDLLVHARDHVPYYREIMQARGIRPEEVRDLEVIRSFPVLTKDAIRTRGLEMIADNLRPGEYSIHKSGGTTGEPIASYIDRRAEAIMTHAAFRGDQWIGWRPWMRTIRLWGGSLARPGAKGLKSKLRSFVLGEVPLSAFTVNARTARDYAEAIQRAGPCAMIGYSSAIYLLAQEVSRLNYRSWPLKVIMPTAAEMPADWGRYISEVFQCPVRRYFGCAEINALGYQVTDDGPYVIPDEHVYLESVQPGTPEAEVVPVGSLLITSLYNRARPLIRYANGDLGDIAPPGTLHPTRSCIRELSGRSADMFVLRDGTRVSANFGAKIISALKPPVKRFQFIQEDYDRVEFRYEPLDRELTAGEIEEITRLLRSHMADDLRVSVVRTVDFVVSSSRKHRTMICRVPSADLPPRAA